MKKLVQWGLVVAAAALLQATWLEGIRFRGVMPDLIVVLMVYGAVAGGEERAMFTGALGGLLQDVGGNQTLGHHVLCHVLVGYVLGLVASRLITEHPSVKAGLVFLAALVDGTIFSFVSYVQDPSLGLVSGILTNVVPAAFYTAVVTPFVFFILNWSLRERRRSPGGGPLDARE